MLMWQGSWQQRTRAGRGQQRQTTINHWQEHLVMQISLAGFGGTLAGLSLAQRGRSPFVPLPRRLAIGMRANNCGWFPPWRSSGTSLPCNGRGWVRGGHDDSNEDGDNNDRRIVPWSVNGTCGGWLRDRGGPPPGCCSAERLAVGCKSLIFHSIKHASHLLLISFLFAILFLYHFTWKLCATGCSLQNYCLCATSCFTQCNMKQHK